MLKKRKPMPKRSPLRTLDPFLDVDGIIRVGGRRQACHLPYNEQHPVILPKDGWLSNLVVDWAHQVSLHGRPTLTYACALRKAWIIGGRNQVRARVRRCVTCVRATAQPRTQLMGTLPEPHVTPS